VKRCVWLLALAASIAGSGPASAEQFPIHGFVQAASSYRVIQPDGCPATQRLACEEPFILGEGRVRLELAPRGEWWALNTKTELIYDAVGQDVNVDLREGYLDLLRYPSSVATVALTTFALLVTLVPSVVAAGVGWSWARVMLLGGALPPEAVAAIVLFVVLWLGGLALAAGVAAWRSCAWTAEWLRHRVGSGWDAGTVGEHEVGTIGGSGSPRPGGWSSDGSSGTV